tara:strand:+ start:263 stop:394 length:132 start_codon:yes stop_codon:yes gene_type:complete
MITNPYSGKYIPNTKNAIETMKEIIENFFPKLDKKLPKKVTKK